MKNKALLLAVGCFEIGGIGIVMLRSYSAFYSPKDSWDKSEWQTTYTGYTVPKSWRVEQFDSGGATLVVFSEQASESEDASMFLPVFSIKSYANEYRVDDTLISTSFEEWILTQIGNRPQMPVTFAGRKMIAAEYKGEQFLFFREGNWFVTIRYKIDSRHQDQIERIIRLHFSEKE